jgi:hypothetical protein
MNGKTGLNRRASVSLAIAVALATASGAHARTGSEAPRADAARNAVAVHPSAEPAAAASPDRIRAGGDETRRQPHTATQGGGLDRRDAAVVAGIATGVFVMGFWGYLVVGAVIAGAAALVEAGVRIVTGHPKPSRGWADWPGDTAPSDSPSERGVSRPGVADARSRPLSRRTSPSGFRHAR